MSGVNYFLTTTKDPYTVMPALGIIISILISFSSKSDRVEHVPRTNTDPTVGKINALCANLMPASLFTRVASPARRIPSEILKNARSLLDLLLEGCEMIVRMLRRMIVTPEATKKYVNCKQACQHCKYIWEESVGSKTHD